MRILFTGCYGRQVTEERFARDYTPTERPWVMALRQLGHEVTVRSVAVGEAGLRDAFDYAVVGLNTYNSRVSAHKYGALWAASQLRHCCMIGDWQLEAIVGSLRDPEGTLWQLDEGDDYLAAMNCEQVHAAAGRIARERHPMVLPVHGWGDVNGFYRHWKRGGQAHSWDPTPVLWDELPMDDEAWRPRRKAWFCTSLSNVDPLLRKLELSWPVEGYWNKKRHQYVPEADILERHLREYAGTVMPTHYPKNAIPGWWRARNAHYASRLIPVCADRGEMGAIGSYYPPGREIEGMTDEGRLQLAISQRRAVLKHTQPLADCLASLARILEEAAVEPLAPV